MSDIHHTTLGGGRRVTLPADLCRALGLRDGDPLVVQRRDGELVILSLDQRAERMRGELAALTHGADLSSDLQDLRRADAEHEARLSR